MSKMKDKLGQKKDSSNSKWLEFFELTSLHGYGYLFRENKPPSHTVGWVCVIIASMSCLSVLLYMNIDEFIRSSVSFNLESATTPLSEVYFPSIAICNMNKLRKSFIYTLLKDPALSNNDYNDLLQVIDKVFINGLDETTNLTKKESELVNITINSPTFEKLFQESLSQAMKSNVSLGDIPISKWHYLSAFTINNETIADIRRASVIELASQFRDGEMITQIDFSGFGAFYAPSVHTDISESCVWLSPFWTEPSDVLSLLTVKKSVRNGANNGFRMLLDAESYDYAYSSAGTEGFVLAILYHLDIPIMKNSGIQIETGQSVQIAITPTLINTTLPCKRRFTPEKRQCYFSDEIILRHLPPKIGYRYEMSNCLYEAALQKVEKECGCMSAKYKYDDHTYPTCEGTQKKCLNHYLDLMGTERSIDDRGVIKPCLAACEDQKHSLMVTSAGYPNVESFHLSSDFCLVLKKIQQSCAGDRIESLNEWDDDICPNIQSSESLDCKSIQRNEAKNVSIDDLKKIRYSVAKYAKRNMAKINVFIGDSYVQKFLTEEKITEISFVGNIGGLLGLFVGFSFISAVEFLYYLIVVKKSPQSNCKTSKRKKTNVQPKPSMNNKKPINAWISRLDEKT